jgi:hydrogenase-4 component E
VTLQILDWYFALVLMVNFFILGSTRMPAMIWAVGAQGFLLGLVFPSAHQTAATWGGSDGLDPDEAWAIARIAMLSAVLMVVKGFVIPGMLFRALRQADVPDREESLLGQTPPLLVGAVGTGLAMVFARELPLRPEHAGTLIIPSALATVLTGFIVMVTRQTALAVVIGYLVLEDGVFIFGLLLVEAVPVLVEVGILLDVFVGVFVMGIIIHHVSRAVPAPSSEHLSSLREE